MTPLAIHDARSALRLFRSQRTFAASVVLTVATASGFLGVAVNLAVSVLAPYFHQGPESIPMTRLIIDDVILGGAKADDALAAVLPIAAVLLLAGGMVLVAACVNLATLSTNQYRTRLGEFAIRASVGGTPSRLLRQLFAEGVVLSLMASALGGVFAFWTRQTMFGFFSPEQAAIVEESFSASVTLATSGLTLALCAAVFFSCARFASGLGLPLLRADVSLSIGAKGARPVGILVVAQVAVASASLVGATMLRDGLNHSLQVGPGLTSSGVAVIHAIAQKRYEDPARGRRFQYEALERVSRTPGVESVAWTSSLPLVSTSRTGYSRDEAGPFLPYDTVMISSGYFETMRHPILNGREFDAEHDATRADAAIVNLPLAQALFADGALRRHLLTDTGRRLEIIGMVSDAKYRKMAESVRPTVFVPLSTMYLSGLHLVTRTEGHASRMIPAIAEVVRSIDNPEIDRETTLDLHLQTAVRREQVAMVFVGACSVMILLFALIGPYLLTRHSVRSRQDELAVRVAIGARRKHLFELVMSHAARATLAGILIGEASALAVGASFGYIPGNSIATAIPPSLAIAAILMGSCAVSAALPTVRILRVNPASALR